MGAARTPETTQIDITGANCSWCLNETVEVLRQREGVVSVDTSITAQCLRIVHHGVDEAVLLDAVRAHLHGDDTSTAEHLMIDLRPVVAAHPCRHAPGGHPDA